jgi:hypothetical protein
MREGVLTNSRHFERKEQGKFCWIEELFESGEERAVVFVGGSKIVDGSRVGTDYLMTRILIWSRPIWVITTYTVTTILYSRLFNLRVNRHEYFEVTLDFKIWVMNHNPSGYFPF